MALRITNFLGLRLLQENLTGFLCAPVLKTNLEFVRHRKTKHWNPKFKLFRKLKVMKIEIPKYNENPKDITEEEMRSRLKEQGLLPKRPWNEKQYFISSTGTTFEAYIPPEGDGKVSPITAQGAKQNLEFLQKKTKTMMAIRKVKQFDEYFDVADFCEESKRIYIKMHELMAAKDKENIIDYITERAYPEVMHNIENKTIRWKYIKDVELPRVVHARCVDVITPENIFGQITVRFHTQQILAIYDRFGRLMHGSEIIAKDVLEYVVFEKHLANQYGIWRVHNKIIPDWMPPRQPSALTYRRTAPKEELYQSAVKEAPTTATLTKDGEPKSEKSIN